MIDINTLRKWLSATNLFYAGTVVCALITLIFIGLIYATQTDKNMQASLLLSSAEGIITDIGAQNSEIEKLVNQHYSLLPENFYTILNDDFKVNDLTRYFDELEQTYSQQGFFRINSLNYTASSPENNFLEADLSLETNQENLMDLLSFIESTGFNNTNSKYLMEVTTIDFSIPQEVETEDSLDTFFSPTSSSGLTYSVTLNLRIYHFQAQNVEITPSE